LTERNDYSMKKQFALITTCLLAAALSGCGEAPAEPDGAAVLPEASSGSPSASAVMDSQPSGEGGANLFTEWLPEGVTPVQAETEPLPELARAIAEEYDIPEEEWESTKYYYNYVDLNGDGTDEIFAVVMGPWTSGSGGDSGLWLIPYNGMSVSQTFTLVRTPIVVSDTVTNGAHELVLQRSGGGGETEYVRLVCSDGVYSNPADAEVMEDISGLTGVALISNDLIADAELSEYLSLTDAADAP